MTFNELMQGIAALIGESAKTGFYIITIFLCIAIAITLVSAFVNIIVDFMIDDSKLLHKVQYILSCIHEIVLILFLIIILIGLFEFIIRFN